MRSLLLKLSAPILFLNPLIHGPLYTLLVFKYLSLGNHVMVEVDPLK